MFVMNTQHSKTDVILIGGGIMSATLGTLLKELTPEKDIQLFERLSQPGEESSNVWNNAGTGHSALCELNYTKEGRDGSVLYGNYCGFKNDESSKQRISVVIFISL